MALVRSLLLEDFSSVDS